MSTTTTHPPATLPPKLPGSMTLPAGTSTPPPLPGQPPAAQPAAAPPTSAPPPLPGQPAAAAAAPAPAAGGDGSAPVPAPALAADDASPPSAAAAAPAPAADDAAPAAASAAVPAPATTTTTDKTITSPSPAAAAAAASPEPAKKDAAPAVTPGPQRPRFPARISGSREELIARLTYYFEKNSPNLISQVPMLIQRYGQREADLWDSLFDKYGPEPDVPKAGLDLKTRLVHFFRKYDAKYESKVDKIMQSYAGHEDSMWKCLYTQYGPEDTEPAMDPSVFTAKASPDALAMDLTSRLRRFFERHDAERVNSADQLAFEFADKEAELRAMLKAMYFEELEAPPPSASRGRSRGTAKSPSPGGTNDGMSPGSGRRGGSPSPSSRLEMRAWLKGFFAHHSPERVPKVDEIMSQFSGREDQLFEALEASFGTLDPAGSLPTMDRLVRIFAAYEPERGIEQIVAFRDKYRGKEDQMMSMLVQKYGPEPTGPVPKYTMPAAAVQPTSRSLLDDSAFKQQQQQQPVAASPTPATAAPAPQQQQPAPAADDAPAPAVAAPAPQQQQTAPAAVQQPPRSHRDRLLVMYQKYDATKLGKVDAALARYAGNEEAIFDQLKAKFSVADEPASPEFEQLLAAANATVSSGNLQPTPSMAPSPTAPASALAAGQATKSHRDRLLVMYQKYDPTKLGNVDAALARYPGNEEAIFVQLKKKFNVADEPVSPEFEQLLAAANAAVSSGNLHPSPSMAQSPTAPGPAATQTQRSHRDRLLVMYQKYDPTKLGNVDAALGRYAGNEEAIFDQLKKKFSVTDEPASPEFEQLLAAANAAIAAGNLQPTPSMAQSPTAPGPAAAQQQQPPRSQRDRLLVFYQKYDPPKLAKVDTLLAKYAGDEDNMWKTLYAKNNVTSEPVSPEFEQLLAAANAAIANGTVPASPTAPAAGGAQQQQQPRSHRDRLLVMYQKYDPTKLGNVDTALARYAGNEEAIFDQLKKKFKVTDEPVSPEFEQLLAAANAAVASGNLQPTPSMAQSPTAPAAGGGGDPEREAHRQKLVQFFQQKDPTQVANVDRLLDGYRESGYDDMWAKLTQHYGQ